MTSFNLESILKSKDFYLWIIIFLFIFLMRLIQTKTHYQRRLPPVVYRSMIIILLIYMAYHGHMYGFIMLVIILIFENIITRELGQEGLTTMKTSSNPITAQITNKTEPNPITAGDTTTDTTTTTDPTTTTATATTTTTSEPNPITAGTTATNPNNKLSTLKTAVMDIEKIKEHIPKNTGDLMSIDPTRNSKNSNQLPMPNKRFDLSNLSATTKESFKAGVGSF